MCNIEIKCCRLRRDPKDVTFQLVRDAVSRFADAASKADTLKALNEVDHAIIVKGDEVNNSIERIEALSKNFPGVALNE